MKIKKAAAILAAFILLFVPGQKIQAQETGTILISLPADFGQDDAEISIYQAASALTTEDGSLSYSADAGFEPFQNDFENFDSLSDIALQTLCEEMEQSVKDSKIQELTSVDIQKGQTVSVEGLEEGLYFAMAPYAENMQITSFLVSIPKNGSYTVDASLKWSDGSSAQTGSVTEKEGGTIPDTSNPYLSAILLGAAGAVLILAGLLINAAGKKDHA